MGVTGRTMFGMWEKPSPFLADLVQDVHILKTYHFFFQMLNDLIFKKFSIRHLVTAVYHPQTNGQDERTNGTLKRHLSKVKYRLMNVDDYLIVKL